MPIREANRDKAFVGSSREDALWQNLQRKFVKVALKMSGQTATPSP